MVISVSCTPAAAGAGASIQVDGWDPQSLKRKAHTVYDLPSTIMIDQPDIALCAAVGEGQARIASGVRMPVFPEHSPRP
jgi:hypothetical protein